MTKTAHSTGALVLWCSGSALHCVVTSVICTVNIRFPEIGTYIDEGYYLVTLLLGPVISLTNRYEQKLAIQNSAESDEP